MKTSEELQKEMIEHYEHVVEVCNKMLQLSGNCLSLCNSIVINKERLMTVTVDENHMTKHEFSPLFPTYFSPKNAQKIVREDVYEDCNGNRILLEIVGEREYYQLLKADAEKSLTNIREFTEMLKNR